MILTVKFVIIYDDIRFNDIANNFLHNMIFQFLLFSQEFVQIKEGENGRSSAYSMILIFHVFKQLFL